MPDKKELYSDLRGVTKKEHKRIRSINGSMSFFAVSTRFDIAMEINRIAQTQEKPTQGTIRAQNRVMAYLAGTAHYKLKVPVVGCNVWTNYSDSDHAGDRESGTTSRTGVMLLLNGMPVHWRSNKQPTTSLSSAEAEIYALAEAVKDVKYRYWVAEEMGDRMNWPAEILVDNAAGIAFQQSINSSTKLKGMIQLRDTWVQEMKDSKYIKAVKVSTETNVADLLTKCLGATIRNRLIGVVEQTASLIATSRFRGHVGRGRRLRTIRP